MKEKFYITTSIAYVNAPPHIGFALEAVQADTIARLERLSGKDVYFLSGTDEHGAKIARAAKNAGKKEIDFVNGNSGLFRTLLENLHISNNDFIRTSDQIRHWPGAVELWKKITQAGDLYKAIYKGLYCVGHEAFITEKDMKDGKCIDHGAAPEILEEENYYFRLSRYAAEIKKLISKDELKIFPESKKNEMLALIDGGLKDISFSRPAKDIPWGIAVPGDPTQTMYVWYDALVNYISALGFGGKDEQYFKKFWPADMHVIGKDILRFHALIWPAMLLSAGIALPRLIFVHGFITIGGHKMSKTLGNVVDPFDLISRFGADALRYYLLREIMPFEDGDFTEEKFLAGYNANLAHGVGNYISRVSKMVSEYFGSEITKPDDAEISKVPLIIPADILKGTALEHMETFGVDFYIDQYIRPRYLDAAYSFKFSNALDTVWELISELDRYIQAYEPFKLIKTNRGKTQAVLWETVYGALAVADMLEPFLPDTAEKIFKMFGVAQEAYKDTNSLKIFPHAALFPKKEK